MDRDKLTKKILQTAAGNRLTCEQAHNLSRELSIPLSEIGSVCNELKIKISACQLGCF